MAPIKSKQAPQVVEFRESLVNEIKELFPQACTLEPDFKYESILDVPSMKSPIYYVEDVAEYSEVIRLIGSVRLEYPFVIIRLADNTLNDKTIELLSNSRYVFNIRGYTLVVAMRGRPPSIQNIKQKFKVPNVLQLKEIF